MMTPEEVRVAARLPKMVTAAAGIETAISHAAAWRVLAVLAVLVVLEVLEVLVALQAREAQGVLEQCPTTQYTAQ
jgi:uncharacterized membrane protein